MELRFVGLKTTYFSRLFLQIGVPMENPPASSQSPLSVPLFRNAWITGILAHMALLVQGVAVAWQMVEIAPSESMVAWVQSAIYLPMMLLSIPAGAIADLFNKKHVSLIGMVLAATSGSVLFSLSWLELQTPATLLALCSLTGTGIALYDPAWQTAVPAIVSSEQLPRAIALRSMSQNLARAIGPAFAGLVIAWFGGEAAFLAAAALFLPTIIVLLGWTYNALPVRLPPERIDKAIVTGIRFVKNSPATRIIVIRGFLMGSMGVGLLALMPLAAKNIIQGDSIDYGLLLCAFGVGAVFGAKLMSSLQPKLGGEKLLMLSMPALSAGALAMAHITDVLLLAPILLLAGMGWLTTFATLNVSVQTISPKWVMGRTLSTYAAATTGGMVTGSLVWGEFVTLFGISNTLTLVGVSLLVAVVMGRWLPMPDHLGPAHPIPGPAPNIPLALDITHRSGPIAIEQQYRIPPAAARRFYRVMQRMERHRKRNGAYDWSISRDITNEALWLERFHLPTWLDFLRLPDRATNRDEKLWHEVNNLIEPESLITTRYWLERPLGSVRWNEDVLDTSAGETGPRHYE